MNKSLVILLVVFSIVWIVIILKMVRESKISIKYSMIWLFMALVIFLVGITPKFMKFIANTSGFAATSSLVVGIILTLLLMITLFLTVIVTNQKTQINNLIQEISILKKDKCLYL